MTRFPWKMHRKYGKISQKESIKGTKSLNSLYVQTLPYVPGTLCNEIQERMAANTIYTMGCTCRMGLYGNIVIRFRYDDDLTNRETVEAFIRQAGVALQRRYPKRRNSGRRKNGSKC